MAKPATPATPARLTVRAKADGFCDGHRAAGKVFDLPSADLFAPSWMEAVGWSPAKPGRDGDTQD